MATHGPIAQKLLKEIKKARSAKVLDLEVARSARATFDEIEQRARASHAEAPPLFALYAYVHNVITVVAEVPIDHPALRKHADRIARAEDEYLPSGPPMSPLTKSFFCTWVLYDLSVGLRKETVGQCVLALQRELGMADAFVRIAENLVDSKMSMYLLVAHEPEGRMRLRELVTDREIVAICGSGHRGAAGELWFARVLPPRVPTLDDHTVFATPYVVSPFHARAWREYLDRALAGAVADRTAAFEELMKRGPGGRYWSEYLFEAYANHSAKAVFIMGVPDVALSRPHSRESEARARERQTRSIPSSPGAVAPAPWVRHSPRNAVMRGNRNREPLEFRQLGELVKA